MKLIQSMLLMILLVVPVVAAYHYEYNYDYGGYSSVSSSVKESEWARVRESEYARVPAYSGYSGYGFYGNAFSEFSRSRDFDFGRSYEASYTSRMSGYPYGGMPMQRYNNYDSWEYSPNSGYTNSHIGTMPYGYGYYNWY